MNFDPLALKKILQGQIDDFEDVMLPFSEHLIEAKFFMYIDPHLFKKPHDLASSRIQDDEFIFRLAASIGRNGFSGSVLGSIIIIKRSDFSQLKHLVSVSVENFEIANSYLASVSSQHGVSVIDGLHRSMSCKLLNETWEVRHGLQRRDNPVFDEQLISVFNVRLSEEMRSSYRYLPTFSSVYDLETIQEHIINESFWSQIGRVSIERNRNASFKQTFNIFNIIDTCLRKPIIPISRQVFGFTGDDESQPIPIKHVIYSNTTSSFSLSKEQTEEVTKMIQSVENERRKLRSSEQPIKQVLERYYKQYMAIACCSKKAFEFIWRIAVFGMNYFNKNKELTKFFFQNREIIAQFAKLEPNFQDSVITRFFESVSQNKKPNLKNLMDAAILNHQSKRYEKKVGSILTHSTPLSNSLQKAYMSSSNICNFINFRYHYFCFIFLTVSLPHSQQSPFSMFSQICSPRIYINRRIL